MIFESDQDMQLAGRIHLFPCSRGNNNRSPLIDSVANAVSALNHPAASSRVLRLQVRIAKRSKLRGIRPIAIKAAGKDCVPDRPWKGGEPQAASQIPPCEKACRAKSPPVLSPADVSDANK